MENHESNFTDIEVGLEKRNHKKDFWRNSKQDEGCSNITVAQDLSLSIMTIFEIDSIEMEEGFIY